MARRTPPPRSLSDAFTKARSPGAKPPSVSLIVRGVKYRAGQAPVQVCPAGASVRRTALLKRV
jgi:hypothetical protein